MTERKITGMHVFFGFLGAFGVIIAVNFTLAYSAVKTFPGVEVKNSYIASQTFDDRRAAQQELGWKVEATHAQGQLRLSIRDDNGRPVKAAQIHATVGRATHVREDSQPEFRFDGVSYVAPLELSDGNWNVRMRALSADGTEFQQRVVLIKE
ncbi:FixH family protein [Roseovarius rhodophyticola]|uniref:FixH family protein n=1 Tax=Roseovarius rhodophyticola TaxID=3080827 RepID=A0ABZ2TAP9_9RHOB|nr:FixH family protein [Roseovarius sp. W115]MDV2930477.1 FixH family protein [Roseovarius sp. W115]